MFILKQANNESEAQHIGLYIEQVALQAGWSKQRGLVRRSAIKESSSIKKISMAYYTLLRMESSTTTLMTFSIVADKEYEVANQFKRDHEFLVKAVNYARELLLYPEKIAEHEYQMKEYTMQIFFSECRYNAKLPPYDFNQYDEQSYKKEIHDRFNQRLKNDHRVLDELSNRFNNKNKNKK